MQIFLHFTATNLYSIIIILQLHQLLFFPIYFDMSSPIFHMTPEIAPLFLKGMGGPKQDPKGLLRLHLKFKSAAKGKPVLWSAESLAKTYGESHSTFLMKYSKFPIQCISGTSLLLGWWTEPLHLRKVFKYLHYG